MKEQIRKLREQLGRRQHIIDRGKVTRIPAPLPATQYAVQIRYKLTHAMTMEQAEEDNDVLCASIERAIPVTLGFEFESSEVYGY